jgi:hypothetical protein
MKTRLVRSILLAVCSALVFSAIVTLTEPVPSAQAAQAAQPPQPASDQGSQSKQSDSARATTPPRDYSVAATSMFGGVLALLAILFGLLFWWSNKLDQTGYLGTLYRDTLEEIEYGRLATALREKLDKGQFYEEVEQDDKWLELNPMPTPSEESQKAGIVPLAFFPNINLYSGSSPSDPYSGSSTSTGTGGGWDANRSPEEQMKLSKLQAQYYQEMNAWKLKVVNEARRRYHNALGDEGNGARKKARDRAEKALSVDLAVLRGRGPEFVLEFTAVVVIIFAAVALGVLGILTNEQIGTLLAAIAGYVLGKATSRTQTKTGDAVVAETDTRTSAKTTELAELLRVVRGTASPAPPKHDAAIPNGGGSNPAPPK